MNGQKLYRLKDLSVNKPVIQLKFMDMNYSMEDTSMKSKVHNERTDYITRLKEAYQRHTALEKSKATDGHDENDVPDKRTEI